MSENEELQPIKFFGKVNLEGRGELKATAPSISRSFSLTHLQSAAIMAQECFRLEKADIVRDEVQHARQIAFSTNTLFSSVAFLEANINESFEGIVTNSPIIKVSEPHSRIIVKTWKHINEHKAYSILDKYQIFLDLVDETPFEYDRSKTPPQTGSLADIKDLIELRNSLMHYNLLWEGGNEARKVRKLRDDLRARLGSNPNPLVSGNVFFLDKYLCYTFCKWAVNSSITFVSAFFTRIGTTKLPFEHLLNQLELP